MLFGSLNSLSFSPIMYLRRENSTLNIQTDCYPWPFSLYTAYTPQLNVKGHSQGMGKGFPGCSFPGYQGLCIDCPELLVPKPTIKVEGGPQEGLGSLYLF